MLRGWGSAASFCLSGGEGGGAPRFGYPRLKAQRRDTETPKICRISITRGVPADLSASAVPAGRVWRPIQPRPRIRPNYHRMAGYFATASCRKSDPFLPAHGLPWESAAKSQISPLRMPGLAHISSQFRPKPLNSLRSRDTEKKRLCAAVIRGSSHNAVSSSARTPEGAAPPPATRKAAP